MMPVMRNQNWLPSLFNDFFGDEWMGMQHKHASVPAINIIENEKDFRVELAVPGTTKEDFKVNVNADNELVISLEKRSEKEEKEGDKDKKEGHRGPNLWRSLRTGGTSGKKPKMPGSLWDGKPWEIFPGAAPCPTG